MGSVARFIEQTLSLKVNKDKSQVMRSKDSNFLGFGFSWNHYLGKGSKVSDKSIKRFKDKIRLLTNSRKRVRFADFIKDIRIYLIGWKGYFGNAQIKLELFLRLDSWIRRRIRCFIWQQWRRIKTRFKKLKQFGIGDELALTTAATGKRAWRVSNSPALNYAFPISYFDRVGVPRLYEN